MIEWTLCVNGSFVPVCPLTFPLHTSQLRCRSSLLVSFVPMCVSVPPVRHIPRFGQQLHPRPPACPPPPPPPPPPHPPRRCAAVRCRAAKSRRGTSGHKARLERNTRLCEVPPEPPPADGTARRGEWGRSRGNSCKGRAFPPVWLLPNPLLDHWEHKTIGSSLPVAYFKKKKRRRRSDGVHVMAANCLHGTEGSFLNFYPKLSSADFQVTQRLSTPPA